MENITLDNKETYDASRHNVYAFRHGTDALEGVTLGLGNMMSVYPFEIGSIRFHSSESAYIMGLFSNDTKEHHAIQQQLIDQKNGYLAKKDIRLKNEHLGREDWETFNIQWMLYVVWCKVVGNGSFRNLLLSLPHDAVIIEDSTYQKGSKRLVWGLKIKSITVCKRSIERD